MEEDGTPIDCDEVLNLVHDQLFLLLSKSEVWVSVSEQASVAQNASMDDDDESHEIPQPHKEILPVDLPNTNELVSINMISHCEIIWDDFKIPWEMLAPSTVAAFESGNKSSQQYKQLIHMIINMVFEVAETVPLNALNTISSKIVSKFPQAFQDKDDDGKVISDGTHTVFEKLKSRYFSKLREKRHSANNNDDAPSSKKSKIIPKEVESRPEESEKLDENDDLTDQERLNEYAEKKVDDEFYRLLQHCYEHIRAYINNKKTPSLTDVKENWPVIFKSETIKWYFEKQNGADINLFGKMLSEKAEKILAALYNKKNVFVPAITKNQPQNVIALERVSLHFKEDFSNFFIAADNVSN